MAHPGYNPADERVWWWKVAKHLDDAQLALINAIAHNVDDPRPLQDLQARLRDGQAILLYIFYAKGLLPAPQVPSAQVPPRSGPPAPPSVPPPAWTAAPTEPPPPWFPTDMQGDIAAAAAAAAAAAVMSPAPAPDQSADPSMGSPDGSEAPVTSEPAVAANGEAHPADAETANVDAAPVEPVEPSTEVSEAVTSPAEAPRSTETPSSDAAT